LLEQSTCSYVAEAGRAFHIRSGNRNPSRTAGAYSELLCRSRSLVTTFTSVISPCGGGWSSTAGAYFSKARSLVVNMWRRLVVTFSSGMYIVAVVVHQAGGHGAWSHTSEGCIVRSGGWSPHSQSLLQGTEPGREHWVRHGLCSVGHGAWSHTSEGQQSHRNSNLTA
jgi:hypothetical protein